MGKTWLIILMTVLLSTNGWCNDVVHLEKGKPAPYTGLLFTEQKANEVRRELLELDKTRVRLLSREQEVHLLRSASTLREKEIELYRVQNERLIDNQETSDIMRYVWFGLGVAVTGIAVY